MKKLLIPAALLMVIGSISGAAVAVAAPTANWNEYNNQTPSEQIINTAPAGSEAPKPAVQSTLQEFNRENPSSQEVDLAASGSQARKPAVQANFQGFNNESPSSQEMNLAK